MKHCVWMTGNRSITTEKLNEQHAHLRSRTCRPMAGMRWYLNGPHNIFVREAAGQDFVPD